MEHNIIHCGFFVLFCFSYFYFVCIYACVYVYMHVCASYESLVSPIGIRRGSHRTVMSHYVCAQNQTLVLSKTSRYLNH